MLSMTGAKDPDEFIKKYGTERFAMLLDNSRNPVEFELSKLRTTYDTAQADGKVGYLKEACKLFAGIRNPVEREVYITQTANELAISPQAIKAQTPTSISAGWQQQRMTCSAAPTFATQWRRKGCCSA